MEAEIQFELVVTSVLPISECLRLVAQANLKETDGGKETNSIVVSYFIGKKQQETAELLIKYLVESFGWIELGRETTIETKKGTNKYGLVESYKAQLCKVTMEKHGAIRRF